MAEPTLDQLDQEDKKIHGAISRIASHTKGNLGRILGVEKRLEGNSNKITLLKNIIKAQQINIGEKLKSLEPSKVTPLDESIQSITDSVKSIHQTLLDQQDVADDQADDAAVDAEQDKRDAKESGREKTGGIGEGIKKTGGKLLKPVKGAFDRIKEWLIKLFAAKAIMMFMQWFSDPANQKKVSSIFRFIKDWWPAIVTGLLLFCSSMLGPGGIILAVGALVIGFIPKIINAVKSILTFGLAGGKEAEKGEKLANKALKEGEKQDKADPESLKPEDDPADAPEPGTQETPGLEKFNKGGQVPGSGDKDTVPAMLTPGEFVMSKGAVEQYGVDTLEGMNAAAGGTNEPKEVRPGFRGGGLAGYGGGGPIQSNKLFGYSGGGEVVEEKKDGGPKLNKTTDKLAKRIEPLITGQEPKSPLMSLVEKHPMVMMFKGIMKNPIIQNVISGVGKALGGGDKEDPELDLKKAIEDLQKRFNHSIYDGNYRPAGGGGAAPVSGGDSGGGAGSPLDGFIASVSKVPIVGKPLAKATGVLVEGVEDMIEEKLKLATGQDGTATPDAPTRPSTTVAYQNALSGGGGSASTPSSTNPGGKIPNFSASAKVSPHKVKVLGISR